jgi:omega-6 fatty acid desaturase (delta-12 desaturase)
MNTASISNSSVNYELIKDELKNWHQLIKQYQIPNNKKAAFQTIQNFIMFGSIWALQYVLLNTQNWLTIFWVVALAILNGFLLGRIFIVQHDCGHKSFTSSQKWNDIIGTICSFCTIIPYKYWAKNHDFHHAHNAQLETSDIGDVQCLTTEQYSQLTLKQKIRYRIYRNPFYLFTIGGVIYVTIFNRFAFLKTEYFQKVVKNVTYSNVLFLIFYVALAFVLEPSKFIAVQLINLAFFGTYALWFFYIQHQYKDVYKSSKDNWNYLLSAIRGSTFYNLPRIGHWLTGNIGYHHIHHLAPTIPNYNLPKCSKDNPIFQKYAVSLSLLESFKTVYANLWDEETGKMVSFKEHKLKMKNKELENLN